MKYVNIEEVLPGTALGKAIFSMDGQILLSEGASLTPKHLSRLRKFGIQLLPIDIPAIEEAPQKQNKVEQQVHAFMSESIRFIQGEQEDWREHVSAIIHKVVEMAKTQKYLEYLRNENDNLYAHSLMVGLVSTTIGVRHGFSDEKLTLLAMAAFYHDIGKLLPENYNEPDTPLGTDHTWRGYNYLRNEEELDKVVAHVALAHHENLCATGYPRKLKQSSLHEYAQIVAIANTFDKLTHRRDGVSLMKPAEACEFMLAFTNKRYNDVFMNDFLRSVALYPTGSQVVLSNGRHGIVVAQNNGLPQRPIIRVLHSSGSLQEIAVETIDLATMNTLFISDFVT